MELVSYDYLFKKIFLHFNIIKFNIFHKFSHLIYYKFYLKGKNQFFC